MELGWYHARTGGSDLSCQYLSPGLFTFTKVDNGAGLRLSKGDVVTVGRIVDDEWYQGYNNEDICGYFPRAFVSVRKYVGRFKSTF